MRLIILLLIICSAVAIADITVTKNIDGTLAVGEDARISIDIKNNYTDDIIVEMKDTNNIGGNSLIIQCLQTTIPAGQTVTIPYDALELYKIGTFTLDSVTATYTDPKGKEKIVTSKPVEVSISGNDGQVNIQAVTEVYKCNGRSSTQTRFVSGGGSSTSMSFSLGNQNQPLPQKKVNDNRTKLIELIYQDEKYKRLEEQLVSNGFILQERAINATSESTGSFIYMFKNGNKKSYLEGTVNEGKIDSINRTDTVSETIVEGLASIASIIFFALLMYGLYIYSEKKHKKRLKKIKKDTEVLKDSKKEHKKRTSIKSIASRPVDEIQETLRRYLKEELEISKQITDTRLIKKAQENNHKNASIISKIFKELQAIKYANLKDDKKLKELLGKLK